MASCGCDSVVPASVSAPTSARRTYVHCPVSIPRLRAVPGSVKMPQQSHLWHELHRSVCALERKAGAVLPDWTNAFYRESFPERQCVGEACNVYL